MLFGVLADIGASAGDSLLDVGAASSICTAGCAHESGLPLLCGELFDFEWCTRSFDWVVLSGTLNWNLHDDGDYARKVIARMFELSRYGEHLTAECAKVFHSTAQLGDMKAYDADEMLRFCTTLTRDCHCRSERPDAMAIHGRLF